MNVNISNKVVVITGSSRGIGREMAKGFAQEHAKVVINYLNSYDEALKLYKEINENNKNCIMVKADITKQEDVKQLCKKTIDAFGCIDVLVNNAGICSDNLTPLMTELQWRKVIDLNLNSVFLCSRIFAKEMMKRKEGKIVNIASFKGQVGSEGQANYSASKAGIIGFTKALAKELGRFNISVNAVCPGFIVTDLNKHNTMKRVIAEEMSVLGVGDNLMNLLNFIIYISSGKFNAVSGQVFNIDSRIWC